MSDTWIDNNQGSIREGILWSPGRRAENTPPPPKKRRCSVKTSDTLVETNPGVSQGRSSVKSSAALRGANPNVSQGRSFVETSALLENPIRKWVREGLLWRPQLIADMLAARKILCWNQWKTQHERTLWSQGRSTVETYPGFEGHAGTAPKGAVVQRNLQRCGVWHMHVLCKQNHEMNFSHVCLDTSPNERATMRTDRCKFLIRVPGAPNASCSHNNTQKIVQQWKKTHIQ